MNTLSQLTEMSTVPKCNIFLHFSHWDRQNPWICTFEIDTKELKVRLSFEDATPAAAADKCYAAWKNLGHSGIPAALPLTLTVDGGMPY